MSIKKVVTVAVSLAVLALSAMMVVGCSGDGDDEGLIDGLTPTEIDKNLGGGASKLVGEWEFIEDGEEIGDNNREFVSLKSSGDLCVIVFQKVDNFWIGGEYCYATWRVEGNDFIIHQQYGDDRNRMTYSVSGNTFTTTECYGGDSGDCYTSRLTRANITAFRNSAGTIRTSDPLLYSAPGIYDLMWVLSDSESERLDFDLLWYYGDSRYTSDNYDERIWYTSGSRLFLIGATRTNCKTGTEDGWTYEYDCALTATETVELQYRFQTVGGERRLIITHNGQDDVWLPRDLRGYYYSPPLAKRSADKRDNPLFGKFTRNR